MRDSVIEDRLDKAQIMLDSIARIQKLSRRKRDDHRVIFDELLDATIHVTESEYGFIGEILINENDQKYLKVYSISNIAWDAESLKFYEEGIDQGIEFRNLKTLFGHVITTGESLIANDAKTHNKAGGIPQGHPALNSFLGIPLYAGDEFVGMVGVANRVNGYDQELIDQCDPLFVTMGNLIQSNRSDSFRRKAEDDLEATNARLNQAMEMSRIGYWDLDLIKGELKWDDVTKRIHDVEPEDQPQLEEAINFYASESHGRVRQCVQTAIDTGSSFQFEEQIVTRTGQRKWVRARGRAVIRGDEVVGLSGVFQDITDTKQRELDLQAALSKASRLQAAESEARAALRSSEYRLQSAIEAGKLGIWSYMPGDDTIYASARWAEILERPPFAVTMSSEQVFNLIHPDDQEKLQEESMKHFRGETDGYTVDVRHRCASGHYKWLHCHGMVIEREDDGSPRLICGTVQDVSDRKVMETELDQLTRKLKIALQASSTGVWSLNIETGELFWDEGMERIYGVEHSSEPREYDDWARHVHPDDLDMAAKAVQDTIDSGTPYNIEFRIYTKDGELRYLRGEALNYELNPGERHIIGVNIDVTRDVQLNQTLEEKRAEAEAANLAKSQFLANMSHEIRTPLNGILGMAQLLSRTDLDATQKDYAKTILTSGRSLLELIEEVLDISKIEAGQLELHPEPFDLSDLVESTVQTLQGQADQKMLSLQSEIEPDVTSSVYGDRKRVRQVLINLLGNAVKFTDQGFVKLRVAQAGSNIIRFEISDSGPGIDMSQRDIIFDRFAQADGSKTRQHGGAGLGLAICKEIVTLAGGMINVRSDVGEGSTFWFDIPLPESADIPSVAQPAPSEQNGETGNGKRILVAEDNAINRAVASGMLRGAGYEVFEAENGTIALEMIKSCHPHAILLDLHMPETNGDDVLRQLQADPNTRNTPVFVLSADATPESRQLLLEQGALDYFTKPLDLQAILRRLNEELSDYEVASKMVS